MIQYKLRKYALTVSELTVSLNAHTGVCNVYIKNKIFHINVCPDFIENRNILLTGIP